MKKAVSFFLCCAIAAVWMTGCFDNSKGNKRTEEKTFIIETPYCNLQYPEKWQDSVKIDVDESAYYRVRFSTDGAPLFDLAFDGGDGYVLGTLKSEDKNTVLRITSYDFDENDGNYVTYCMMQEDVNVILEHLTAEYDFAAGELIEEEDTSVFEIKTSVVTLYYPQKWQDSVTVDVQDDSVKFSSDGLSLFDLRFGGDEGYLLGTYQDTPVYIVSYDIEQGGLPDEEYYDLCAMQEDINVILQHLMDDPNFSLSQ